MPRSSLWKMADGRENHGAERNFYGSSIEDENSASGATDLKVDEKSENPSMTASNTLIRQVVLNSCLRFDLLEAQHCQPLSPHTS